MVIQISQPSPSAHSSGIKFSRNLPLESLDNDAPEPVAPARHDHRRRLSYHPVNRSDGTGG
jgi:hypothetical protein